MLARETEKKIHHAAALVDRPIEGLTECDLQVDG